MNETRERLQAIIDGAPDGATNIDGDDLYWKLNSDFEWMVEMPMLKAFEYKPTIIPDVLPVRSLQDILDKLALMEEVEQLQQQLADAQRERDEALALCDQYTDLIDLDMGEAVEKIIMLHFHTPPEALEELKRREQVKGIEYAASYVIDAGIANAPHDDLFARGYLECTKEQFDLASQIESGEVEIK